MRPAPLTLVVLTVWLTMATAAVFNDTAFEVWRAAGIILVVVMLAESFALFRPLQLSVERRIARSLSLGVWSEVSLRLRNRGESPVWLQVFDHYPTVHTMAGLPRMQRLANRGHVEVGYQLLPRERGEFTFRKVELLVDSPLRLMRRRVMLSSVDKVRVYPNFAAVSKYALLATDNRLSQLGVRKRRRRGEGLEFHQLREYRPGDSLRQVDWRATSRHGKLISREYQDQRDQQVFFLIDCGRRMTAKDDDLSHFDHSLNSVLLLAYVALRQGDAVGLMAFSGDNRYLPPKKGLGVLSPLLNTLYDLQPSMSSPDYTTAASELRKRVKKRSLIVVMTNLRDEDADELLPVLSVLSRRHLVLVASLREQVIGSVLKTPVSGFDDALKVSAAMRYMLGRRKVHDAIANTGALSLDVEPQMLPINLVNRYLEVKGSGRL